MGGLVLICSPVEERVWVPSSVVEAGCGHTVWLADTSAPILDKPGTRSICTPCAAKDPKTQAALERGPKMTPVQREELNGVLGVGETDQTFARLHFEMYDLDEE